MEPSTSTSTASGLNSSFAAQKFPRTFKTFRRMKGNKRKIRNVCTTRCQQKKIKQKWTLQAAECGLRYGSYAESQDFSERSSGLTFVIRLYPSGKMHSVPGFSGLFLRAIECPAGKEICTRFSFRFLVKNSRGNNIKTIGTRDYPWKFTSLTAKDGFGTENFCSSDWVCDWANNPDYELVVECKLAIIDHTQVITKAETVIGSCEFGYKQVRKSIQKIGRWQNLWATSQKWTIEDFMDILQQEKSVTCAPFATDGCSLWTVTLKSADHLTRKQFKKAFPTILVHLQSGQHQIQVLSSDLSICILDSKDNRTIHRQKLRFSVSSPDGSFQAKLGITFGEMEKKIKGDNVIIYLEIKHDQPYFQSIFSTDEFVGANETTSNNLARVLIHHDQGLNEFLVDKSRLCSSSTFFHSYFYGELNAASGHKSDNNNQTTSSHNSNRPNTITLEMPLADFSLILDYVYGKDIITSKNADRLLMLSHQLDLFELKYHCERVLAYNLDFRSVLEVFELSVKYEAQSLLVSSMFVLADYLEQIDLLPIWRRFQHDYPFHASEIQTIAKERDSLHDLQWLL